MAIVFSGGTHHLNGVDVQTASIEVDGAVLYMDGVRCGEITITSGSLYGAEVDCRGITMASSIVNTAHLNGVRIETGDLTLTGGAGLQVVNIAGLYMGGGTKLVSTGTFDEWSVTGLVMGRGSPTGHRIDISDVTEFVLQGKLDRANQHGARFEDCVNGEIDLHIHEPGAQTNNTYDGISLEGVCDRLSIRGSVRGAGSNLPAYGVDVGASCLDIDLWMAITGTATGAVDDNTSGEVTIH